MAGTYSLKRFLQKTPGTEKHLVQRKLEFERNGMGRDFLDPA